MDRAFPGRLSHAMQRRGEANEEKKKQKGGDDSDKLLTRGCAACYPENLPQTSCWAGPVSHCPNVSEQSKLCGRRHKKEGEKQRLRVKACGILAASISLWSCELSLSPTTTGEEAKEVEGTQTIGKWGHHC